MPLPVPEKIETALADFLGAAQAAFDNCLKSVVLFGSAAEGRMRATSDVNLILVLTAFSQKEADALAPALRLARAAIQLEPMFLLDSEVAAAAECFAQKFADIGRRRQVLYGPDPFEGLRISRSAEIFRLQQILLNLTLRLRESYTERSGREDSVALLIADAAGPLRAAAATLLQLETGATLPPKEALEQIVGDTPAWRDAVHCISAIREQRPVDAKRVTGSLFAILEMADALRQRTGRLE